MPRSIAAAHQPRGTQAAPIPTLTQMVRRKAPLNREYSPIFSNKVQSSGFTSQLPRLSTSQLLFPDGSRISDLGSRTSDRVSRNLSIY